MGCPVPWVLSAPTSPGSATCFGKGVNGQPHGWWQLSPRDRAEKDNSLGFFENQPHISHILLPVLSVGCYSRGGHEVIPVSLHTGISFPNTPYECCPKFRTYLGNPQLMEDVLVMHPKLKVQLMHMGYPYLEETKAILNVYPQVNVDVAVVDWRIPTTEFYNYLKALIDAGLEKRIMYGSDEMIWPDALDLSIKNIENAPFLNEEQKQDIFYNNAAKFFNIQQ